MLRMAWNSRLYFVWKADKFIVHVAAHYWVPRLLVVVSLWWNKLEGLYVGRRVTTENSSYMLN